MEIEQVVKVAYFMLTLCRLVGSLALYRIAVRYFERTNNPVPILGKIAIFAFMYFVISRLMMIGVLMLIQLILRAILEALSAAIV